MDIIIRTRKNFWRINSNGIHRVMTLDWNSMAKLFEKSCEDKIKTSKPNEKAQAAIEFVNHVADKGRETAPLNYMNWKERGGWQRLEDNTIPDPRSDDD